MTFISRPLFLLILLSVVLPLRADSIYFVIRVDDIFSSSTSYGAATNYNFERAVEAGGGKVTYVTIPHRLIEWHNATGYLTRELESSILRGHEIAQHGQDHRCDRCASTGHEMFCATYNSGFTLSQQKNNLAAGFRLLRDTVGVIPVSFVSPGHYEDSVTYRALAESGFSIISTTKHPTKSEVYPGLYNLAPNEEFTWLIKEPDYNTKLNAALADIDLRGPEQGYYCLLLHDPFIRPSYENGIVVRWVKQLMDSLNVRYGGRIVYTTLTDAADKLRGITTIKDETQNPEQFSLSEIYPNPFNPETSVKFTISDYSQVRTEVFDITGKSVKVLTDDYYHPGTYTLRWQGKDENNLSVASGTYFIKLSSGGRHLIKKALLLK